MPGDARDVRRAVLSVWWGGATSVGIVAVIWGGCPLCAPYVEVERDSVLNHDAP